jgi:Protein of unknown function (DUF2442)
MKIQRTTDLEAEMRQVARGEIPAPADAALPRVVAVAAGNKPMTLRIRWDKGDESLVDVSGLIETFRVYEPLRHSPKLFRQARVGEHGTDIVWSDEIDMAADTLWRLAQEQAAIAELAADGDDDLEWAKPLLDEARASIARGDVLTLEKHRQRNVARRVLRGG